MRDYFQYDLKVQSEHLDALAHVNNVQYLQWVQEIAEAHWSSLTAEKNETYGIWVVRSHKIEYKRPAQFGDVLTLKTFVAHTEGFLSERVVKIYFKDTNTLLAQCSPQWCYLHPQTRKPESIPQKVIELFH